MKEARTNLQRSLPHLWQSSAEWVFIAARVLITYSGTIVFLATAPVVRVVQMIALSLQQFLPFLAVDDVISYSTRAEATDQALLVVWFGKRTPLLLSSAETAHLLDVHQLFLLGGYFVACMIIIAVILERRVVRLWAARIYRRISIGVVVSSIVGGVCFEPAFSLFHQLFFPHGNFAFPVDSMLIQCFPPVFWLLNFLLLQLGVAVLLYLQSHHAERVGI